MKSVTAKLIFTLVSSLWIGNLFAYDVPVKPVGHTRYINDYANLINEEEEKYLNQKLQQYWDSTSTDLVVVTVETLNGEEPFDVGLKIFNTWGIGTSSKDNGVLILIAHENNDPAKRKIWITTGKGAEGFLPDGAAGSIIRHKMGPAFKEKMYGKGINEAIDEIIARSKGEYKNTEAGPKSKFPLFIVIIIIIFLISFMGRNSGTSSRTYGRGGLLGPALWMGMGSGFGSGGSSGGWSGGFGGGSSGGGGAGGGW